MCQICGHVLPGPAAAALFSKRKCTPYTTGDWALTSAGGFYGEAGAKISSSIVWDNDCAANTNLMNWNVPTAALYTNNIILPTNGIVSTNWAVSPQFLNPAGRGSVWFSAASARRARVA